MRSLVFVGNSCPVPSETVDNELAAILARDAPAWRAFVENYEPKLRAVVRQASEATTPLRTDEIDDIIGDFWVRLLERDMRMLRAFRPVHGASLLTWLTFHVAQLAYERIIQKRNEPPTVSLRKARRILAPTTALFSRQSGSAIDAAIRECVQNAVTEVVRAELNAAKQSRDEDDADRPRAAAWWAAQLGCSAESLVKRAKRGSLQAVRIGARYYFTRAQMGVSAHREMEIPAEKTGT